MPDAARRRGLASRHALPHGRRLLAWLPVRMARAVPRVPARGEAPFD